MLKLHAIECLLCLRCRDALARRDAWQCEYAGLCLRCFQVSQETARQHTCASANLLDHREDFYKLDMFWKLLLLAMLLQVSLSGECRLQSKRASDCISSYRSLIARSHTWRALWQPCKMHSKLQSRYKILPGCLKNCTDRHRQLCHLHD